MKLTARRFCIVPIMLLGCVARCLSAQSEGSICLARGDFDTFSKGGATVEQWNEHERRRLEKPDSGAEPEAVRFVQVDKLPPVRVSSLRSGKVTGIDSIGKRWIRVSKRIDMRNPVTSFSFTFSAQGSNELCLWYESFYGSWMLQPRRGRAWCCK